jgi:hypothetical protein
MAVDYFIEQASSLNQSWVQFLFNQYLMICILVLLALALLKLAILSLERSERISEIGRASITHSNQIIKKYTPTKKSRLLKTVGINLVVSVTLIVTVSGSFLLALKTSQQSQSQVSALAAYTLAQQSFYLKHGFYLDQQELENKYAQLSQLPDYDIDLKNSETGFTAEVKDSSKEYKGSNNVCSITVKQGILFWDGGLCLNMKELQAALDSLSTQEPVYWTMKSKSFI